MYKRDNGCVINDKLCDIIWLITSSKYKSNLCRTHIAIYVDYTIVCTIL